MGVSDRPTPLVETVALPADGVTLQGDLVAPADALGLVIFCHGSGSSRHSPRNRRVASDLQAVGLATLLLDLLTPGEEQSDLASGRWRFDIELLAGRVAAAVHYSQSDRRISGLPIGLFGSSTGAAAALAAAAESGSAVRAVVSRGGRPDLAADALPRVLAPTLLIVGGRDTLVLELNRQAAQRLVAAEVAVVPGATHLFEEPGALQCVSQLAADWFVRHLSAAFPGSADQSAGRQ